MTEGERALAAALARAAFPPTAADIGGGDASRDELPIAQFTLPHASAERLAARLRALYTQVARLLLLRALKSPPVICPIIFPVNQ